MAISGAASYIPTTEDFLGHWELVNAALPAGQPLLVSGEALKRTSAIAVAELEGFYTALLAKHAEVQSAINAADIRHAEVATLKGALLAIINLFNPAVRGLMGSSAYAQTLADVPSSSSGQGDFTKPMDDTEDLWERINTAPPPNFAAPLTLTDGTTVFTLADFTTTLGLLKQRYRTAAKADSLVDLRRAERNALQDSIYPVLKFYRMTVPVRLGPTAPLTLTLPRLTPEPGSTPEPAVVSGSYDVPQNRAVVSAQVPVQADLQRIKLLYSPGLEWHGDDTSVVESRSAAGLDLSQPVVFETTYALGTPGSTALFRVEVENDTDNTAQSNTLIIERPA